ncbi:MAG: diguanylate cyclase (GGDEF)-like protein [Gammaproteobacteria bacterium]|jgi:diguanylate cyclase (GGDEF)-like protein
MSRVRQMLPLELLEQPRGIAASVGSLGGLVSALDRQLPRAPELDVNEARLALQRAHVLLRTVRLDFTSDSITAASAAHALANPAVQDMERWLYEGLPGYPPSSRVVLELTRERAREAHDAVHELEHRTDAMALALLGAESERLNRVRYSLMALRLAFSLLAAGAVVLYMRQRSATERVAITEPRLTDSLESVGQTVALFDGNDRLLMCNRGYRDRFQIQPSRDTGVAVLADVMRGALESSRVLSIDDVTDDLTQVYDRSRMRSRTRFELQWNDGRFFQVSEQKTLESGTICFLTDLKIAQRRLEYLASHDALTGLPSRRRFHTDLSQVISRAGESGQQAAVIFVDIDRLKWVNDTYGHGAGDRYLKEFGLCLGSALRAGDGVARLGGDEFVLALGNLRDDVEACSLAQRVLEMLSEPVQVDADTQIRTTVSMGVALYRADGADISTLMKNADDACYYAKRNGRANYQLFNDRISAALSWWSISLRSHYRRVRSSAWKRWFAGSIQNWAVLIRLSSCPSRRIRDLGVSCWETS